MNGKIVRLPPHAKSKKFSLNVQLLLKAGRGRVGRRKGQQRLQQREHTLNQMAAPRRGSFSKTLG